MTHKRRFRDPDDSKLREDVAETAFRVLQEAIGERPRTEPSEKNPSAQKRGAKGGKKGGKARADSLTPERRREIAQKAAEARWRTDVE